MTAARLDHYREFSAPPRRTGPPLELGPSEVTAGEPLSSCEPGPVTTLEPGGRRHYAPGLFSDGSARPR